MMKTLLPAVTAAAVLAACSANGSDAEHKAVGMANPASEYCVRQGGRLEPKKDAEGNEYALCHLPDGRVVEEWVYFRSQNGR